MTLSRRFARPAAVLRDSLRCATAAAAVGVATAGGVRLVGLADDARRMLDFSFQGLPRTHEEMAALALHNARVGGGVLLCAALAPHLARPARRTVDVGLAALLVGNAAEIGLAIGAYGRRVLAAIALHLPLELAALSIAGGAYMQACKRPLSRQLLATTAAASGALLLGAAALETYPPIGTGR
jgi:hypothetical protein